MDWHHRRLRLAATALGYLLSRVRGRVYCEADIAAVSPRSNNKASVVTVTVTVVCPADGTAERIGSSAVVQGLVSAAHTWPVRSVYRWQGEVHYGNEVMLSMVTTTLALEHLVRHVRDEHPYDVADVSVQPRDSTMEVETWVNDSVHVLGESGQRIWREANGKNG